MKHPFFDLNVFFFSPRLCVVTCVRTVCNGQYQDFMPDSGYLDQLTNWKCLDQCQYDCMWRTVAFFHKNQRKTPQFNGKWPFIRFFGMQEPAAAIFSLMNLFAHVQLLQRFHKKIHSDAPMKNVWIIYGLVSINAWVWLLKFIYSEKAIKFCEISTNYLSYVLPVK